MAKVTVSFGECQMCLTWTLSDQQRRGHYSSGRLKCFGVMLCGWETWLAAYSVLNDAIETVDTPQFAIVKNWYLLYSSDGYGIQCQTCVSVACHSCNMWTWTVFLGSLFWSGYPSWSNRQRRLRAQVKRRRRRQDRRRLDLAANVYLEWIAGILPLACVMASLVQQICLRQSGSECRRQNRCNRHRKWQRKKAKPMPILLATEETIWVVYIVAKSYALYGYVLQREQGKLLDAPTTSVLCSRPCYFIAVCPNANC